SSGPAADYPFFDTKEPRDGYMGAFTYCLLDVLRRDPARQLTYATARDAVRAKLLQLGFNQRPQLNGYIDHRFLMLSGEGGPPPAEPARAHPIRPSTNILAQVTAVRGEQVALAAVAGAHLTAGSVFEATGQRSLQVEARPRPVPGGKGAMVRLEMVDGLRASGR